MSGPTKRQIDAYRRRLAKIKRCEQISVEALHAVLTAVARDGRTVVGTIVAMKHEIGYGIFGPTIVSAVKLCPDCVHKVGRLCKSPDALEWVDIVLVESVVRNGDGEPS